MLLSIYTEGVWWVTFITFYMKAIFEINIELFYTLSYTNLYLFTFYIMVQIVITDI